MLQSPEVKTYVTTIQLHENMKISLAYFQQRSYFRHSVFWHEFGVAQPVKPTNGRLIIFAIPFDVASFAEIYFYSSMT